MSGQLAALLATTNTQLGERGTVQKAYGCDMQDGLRNSVRD
jgi:hypothetical protein